MVMVQNHIIYIYKFEEHILTYVLTNMHTLNFEPFSLLEFINYDYVI
jgi:hypothetical protein